MLSPTLATLLDDARAEAKRNGHQAVTPLHLAAALSRRAPQEFENVFGAGSTAALRKRLLTAPPGGSDVETIALLEELRSDEPAEILAALKERLGSLTPGEDAPDASRTATDGRPSTPSAQASETLGASVGGERSDRLLEPVSPNPAIRGFDAFVDELIALLSMRVPATPLILGNGGGGKTSATVALANRLAADGYSGPLAGFRVVRVVSQMILSDNPIAALDRALDAQQPGEIVVVDDLESLLALGSPAAILPMIPRLRGAITDPALRLLLVLDLAYVSRLEALDQELMAAVSRVEIPALPVETLWEIARQQGAALAGHHAVTLPDSVVRLAANPPSSDQHLVHPGLLIDRLDHACARASMRPDHQTRETDLALAATPDVAPLDAEALVAALGRRIRGQDAALRPVAARLALTRAGLDLRPDRPDGVFLFVGPTGVGKTELARALCERLFGDEERMIRLDMSEYSEQWALSRLIGPQPGYVGFTEPESWLTTRIRRQPYTVLLLDEIEKADPAVWNAFLQVFDAGRLSDSRGAVADFDHVVIAMTSNLGGLSFGSVSVGFAAEQDDASSAKRDEQRVLEVVKDAMPPELINRLDELVVFQPLTREAITEIAEIELERVRQRLTERGYIVTIDAQVVHLIADTGYDPAYGARHLQRNVERLLLEPLASVAARELAAEVADGHVVWRAQRPAAQRGAEGKTESAVEE